MKKKGCLVKLLTAVVVIILIVCAVNVYHSWKYQSRFTWPDSGIATNLPDPKTNKGFFSDEDYYISVSVDKYSRKKYDKYLEKCKENGFTKEKEETPEEYIAYNDKGMRLILSYNDTLKDMDVKLYKNLSEDKYTWPSTGLAKLIPEVKSSYGTVVKDSEGEFHLFAGNTDYKAYCSYVDRCIKAGFNKDYDKEKKEFSGENRKGYSLKAEFIGNNTMEISITEPYEDDEEDEDLSEDEGVAEDSVTETEDESGSEEERDGVDEDFAALMKQYEDFFDEYIAFMKKYNESDDVSSMLSDYSSYLEEYSETMEALEDVDEDELTAEEAALYTETMARITKKLEDAGEMM